MFPHAVNGFNLSYTHTMIDKNKFVQLFGLIKRNCVQYKRNLQRVQPANSLILPYSVFVFEADSIISHCDLTFPKMLPDVTQYRQLFPNIIQLLAVFPLDSNFTK